MSHGTGAPNPAQNRSAQRDVFVGKGNLNIPALKKSGKSSEEDTFVSAEDGPPSTCSSTTLSFISFTSDEPSVISETSVSKPHLNAFGHPLKPKSQDIPRPAIPNLARSRDISSTRKAQLRDTNSNSDIASDSDLTCYINKPTQADFPSRKKTPSSIADIQVSSLSGVKIMPDAMRCNTAEPSKVNPNFEYNSGMGNEASTTFSTRDRKCIRGDKSCMTKSTAEELSPKDFVRVFPHRAQSPPPDFIDHETRTYDNVPTTSRQPDLDLILSGAVRSSALLKGKVDFVPTAVMPGVQLRAKSKSLSDLSKREAKTRRFLDRRKVIEMNPNDKECCSHTEITPSSMMTLAMELLFSKNNKASSLFKKAKKRADGDTEGNDSILPSLWVVPKSPSLDSERKTASHLKPVVKSTVTTEIPEKEPSAGSKVTEKGDDSRETGCVRRRSKSKHRYPTATCIALGEQTVDEDIAPDAQNNKYKESIRNEDVEKDLQSLTVADLVGSPDTIFTDTESEFDGGGYQNELASRPHRELVIDAPSVKLQIEPLRKGREKGEKAPAEKVSPPVSVTTKYPHTNDRSETKMKEQSGQGMKKNEEDIRVRNSDPPESSVSLILSSRATDMKSCDAPERRSSSVSNSSSLTTVSSLSLSSTSVGSIEYPAKEGAKTQTSSLNQVQNFCDGGNILIDSQQSVKILQRHKNEMETGPSALKQSDVASTETSWLGHGALTEENTFVYGSRSPSGNLKCYKESAMARANMTHAFRIEAPRPPRRSKSLEVMDKLRKTRNRKEMTKNILVTGTESPMHHRDDAIKSRDAKEFVQGGEVNANPGLFIEKETAPSLLETDDDDIVKHSWFQNSKQSRKACKLQDERHQSKLLILPEGRYADFASPGRPRQLNQVDTLGKNDDESVPLLKEVVSGGYCITSAESMKKPSRGHLEGIPIHKIYSQSLECLGPIRAKGTFREDLQKDADMSTEKWFRNGEISVVDGSRVSLPHRSGNYTIQTEFSNRPAVFLSDIINAKNSPPLFNDYSRGHVEKDFVTPNNVEVISATHQLILTNEGKRFDERDDRTESLSGQGHTSAQTILRNVEEQFIEPTGRGESLIGREYSPPRTSEKIQTSTPQRKVGIVKTTDLEQYFPAYESVEMRKQSPGLGAKVSTYNARPKPFCKPSAVEAPNTTQTNIANFKSQHASSLHDLCSDSTDSFPVGCQSTRPANDRDSSSFDKAKMPNDDVQYRRDDLCAEVDSERPSADDGRTTPNRTATPYGKNSAIKLLIGGKNVYSSCVKITLNPKKLDEDIQEKKVDEVDAPMGGRLDFGHINMVMRRGGNSHLAPHPERNPVRRKSFPMKKEREWKEDNVREVINPDMKVTDMPAMGKQDVPLHTTIDEGDFAGVVDGPTKNVKEIRAMFKGPDYTNYAKPRLVARKRVTSNTKLTAVQAERQTTHSNRNSAEVAQQIIGLFKEALTVEDGTTANDPAPSQQPSVQNGEADNNGPRISVMDKVASFNIGKSPVKENEINNNTEEVILKSQQKPTNSAPPYVEVIKNPAPSVNGHGKKCAVKQEKVKADSYDESLDQFYDILDELTAS